MSDAIIPEAVVEATIEHFTKLDSTGDKRTMNKLARRLGREQPFVLQHAASYKDEHGDDVGEAGVFYATLIWAMFDRHISGTIDRLTEENLTAAQEVVDEALGTIEDLDQRPVHERYTEAQAAKQEHVFAKVRELIEEDVREDAITAECASVIFPLTQVMIEAFHAAVTGERRGERQGPVLREQPKIGRNEPCPCGSGKKYKKCHGKAA